MANSSQFAVRKFFQRAKFWCGLAALLALTTCAHAQLIFDVFVGHGLGIADSTVTEASWFPVTCEIQNDGTSFNGIVEFSGGQFGNGQTRRIAVELPTHTKKRFTVPVYCSGRYRVSVDARLLNEKGKVIAERLNIDARTVVDWQSPLLASLSRSHGGAATFPSSDGRNSTLRPATTHLSPDLFPDNPLTLESITAIYLHSSRAVELKVPQVNALLAWVHNGGHLILGVEQPGDVNGVPWLKGFLPCTLGEVTMRKEHAALQQWVQAVRSDNFLVKGRRPNQGNQPQSMANPFKNLLGDAAFELAELPTVNAVVRDGSVLIGTEDAPLAIQAVRGRGQVTVLLFSPELEPFRSWKNRNWFWAKLGDVPLEWLANANMPSSGWGSSLDAVFGAMVDSKQIRKLPVGWLLLLLLAYLVVIGPLDQYWLKKINRQMLTWITFPTYVVLFSLLIYFIGYKLRSGEMEWNELHVVDVTPHGERSDLRGRIYCSAYSPANAQYAVASEAGYSTLRGEVGKAGAEESKASVEQRGNGFAARLTVPVWTSQLFVNDWWKQGATPLNFTVTQRGDQFDVKIENPSGKRIPQARLIIDGRMHDLGDITKGRQPGPIYRGNGQPLQNFVQSQASQIDVAVNQRQNQFGAQQGGHLHDPFGATTAASFFAAATTENRRIAPPGFDLTPLMERGDAILLAWMPDETVVPTLNQFSPRYSRKDTILRVVAPIGK